MRNDTNNIRYALCTHRRTSPNQHVVVHFARCSNDVEIVSFVCTAAVPDSPTRRTYFENVHSSLECFEYRIPSNTVILWGIFLTSIHLNVLWTGVALLDASALGCFCLILDVDTTTNTQISYYSRRTELNYISSYIITYKYRQ